MVPFFLSGSLAFVPLDRVLTLTTMRAQKSRIPRLLVDVCPAQPRGRQELALFVINMYASCFEVFGGECGNARCDAGNRRRLDERRQSRSQQSGGFAFPPRFLSLLGYSRR